LVTGSGVIREVEQAEATLEEASGVIANGYLRLDPQEWVKACSPNGI
jgi:hypothetical protein